MLSNELKYAFVPCPVNVFKLVEITQHFSTGEIKVSDINNPSKFETVKQSAAFLVSCVDDIKKPPSDLIKLNEVHRPCILYSLRSRFENDLVYTSVGPILVALNPFKWITGLYTESLMKQYLTEEYSLSDKPHVFAVAHDAFVCLVKGTDQSLIISGESGAGKTEATKQALNYLTFCAGSTSSIKERILLASPILEGWGNAKTLRNNNSSRFGKFIEIWFGGKTYNTIVGSTNTTYLLEKTRIVHQEPNERNFHIFYQILCGASSDLLSEFGLQQMAAQPSISRYLNQSGCVSIPDVDDGDDYRIAGEAFNVLGFTECEVHDLYQLIAAILLMGNIEFEPNRSTPDEASIKSAAEAWFNKATQLLRVDSESMRKALLFKQVRTGGAKRNSVVLSPYQPAVAAEGLEALTKEIYSRCFDWIVVKINLLINDQGVSLHSATKMIGILDIFGFEIFKKNSFEQLCINLANESLQQHFNKNIFRVEMDLYTDEAVPLPPLTYNDNQDVLDLITKKPQGLIPVLDEEGMVPKGSWEGYLGKVTKLAPTCPRLKMKQITREFAIIHYAGEVIYDPRQFLTKNKDTLPQDLADVIATSSHVLLAELFKPNEDIASNTSGKATNSASNKMTVGRKFAVQLESLMQKLNATKPRYIRCIKTNAEKLPNKFVPTLTNEQLTYSGIFEAVIIMQSGYPFRIPHLEFREQYHMLVLPAPAEHRVRIFSKGTDTRLQPHHARQQCVELIDFVVARGDKLLEKCFVGKTMMFYRAEQNNLLVKLRNDAIKCAAALINRKWRGQRIFRVMIRLKFLLANCLQNCISTALTLLKENLVKLNAVCMEFAQKSSNPEILVNPRQKFGEFVVVLEADNFHTKQMKILLKECNPSNIVTKYDNVKSAMMAAQKDVKFCSKIRNLSLDYSWKSNEVLASAAVTVDRYEAVVMMKRRLAQGIANDDEVLLEQCLQSLKSLVAEGLMDSIQCAEEEAQGMSIINTAKGNCKDFLVLTRNGILNGNLTVNRVLSTGKLQVAVSGDVLVASLESWANRPSGKRRSHRAVRLTRLYSELTELRHWAESEMWPNIFNRMHSVAGEESELTAVLTGDSDAGGSTESSSEHILKFFRSRISPMCALPQDILIAIEAEHDAYRRACVDYVLLIELADAVDNDGIPSVANQGPLISVDTTQLSATIIKLQAYSKIFDQFASKTVLVAKEHLQLREAVSSGDYNKLRAVFAASRNISRQHKDIFNTNQILNFYKTKQDLLDAMTKDFPSQEPGFLQFDFKCNDDMCQALVIARDLGDISVEWHQLVEVCAVIHRLRVLMAAGSFEEASKQIETLIDSEPWIGSQSARQQKICSAPPGSTSHVTWQAVVEFDKFHLESKHRNSIDVIEQALLAGSTICGDGTLDTDACDMLQLQEALDEHEANVLPTATGQSLLKSCKFIIELRSTLKSGGIGNWREIKKLMFPEHIATKEFSDCHAKCRDEMQHVYNVVLDMELRDELQKSIASSCVKLTATCEIDLASVSTQILAAAVALGSKCHKLTTETAILLFTAKLLLALRLAVVRHSWEEPEAWHFWFSDRPTINLFADPTFVTNTQDESSFYEKAVELFNELDKLKVPNKLRSTGFGVLIGSTKNFDVDTFMSRAKSYCIADILLYAESHLELMNEDHCNEIWTVKQAANERRCRVALFLAASSERLTGSMNQLVVPESFDGSLLRSAIQFTKPQLQKTSKVVSSWLIATEELLKLRLTLQSENSLAVATASPPWLEFINVDTIRMLIQTTVSGFPLDDFNFICAKAQDSNLISGIMLGLDSGRYEDGVLENVSVIELNKALVAVPETAHKSSCLRDLMEIAKICVRIRNAVLIGHWETNESVEQCNSAEGILDTYCHVAANLFSEEFNLPPPVLTNEIQCVQNELEKREILRNFKNEFSRDCISGSLMNVELHKISVDVLHSLLEKSEKWSRSTGRGNDSELAYNVASARELVCVRSEAIQLYSTFIRTPFQSITKFESLEELIDGCNLSSIIKTAQFSISKLMRPAALQNIMSDWSPVMDMVASARYSSRVSEISIEYNRIQAEAASRKFVCQSNMLLRRAVVEKQLADIIDEIEESINDFYTVLASTGQHVNDSISGITINDLQDPSGSRELPVVECHQMSHSVSVVHISVILLLHLLRGKIQKRIEKHDRDWLSEKIVVAPTKLPLVKGKGLPSSQLQPTTRSVPTLTDLVTSIADGQYTLQAVIRSVKKLSVTMCLQPNLIAIATICCQELEDEISSIEMTAALGPTGGQALTDNGLIRLDNINTTTLTRCLERVNKVGMSKQTLQPLYNACNIIFNLRILVKEGNYDSAYNEIVQFLEFDVDNYSPAVLFSAVVAQLVAVDYSIIALAKKEFHVLTLHICDTHWRKLTAAVLSGGAMLGTRAAVKVPEVVKSSAAVEDFLKVLSVLPTIGMKSHHLTTVCVNLLQLRRQVQDMIITTCKLVDELRRSCAYQSSSVAFGHLQVITSNIHDSLSDFTITQEDIMKDCVGDAVMTTVCSSALQESQMLKSYLNLSETVRLCEGALDTSIFTLLGDGLHVNSQNFKALSKSIDKLKLIQLTSAQDETWYSLVSDVAVACVNVCLLGSMSNTSNYNDMLMEITTESSERLERNIGVFCTALSAMKQFLVAGHSQALHTMKVLDNWLEHENILLTVSQELKSIHFLKTILGENIVALSSSSNAGYSQLLLAPKPAQVGYYQESIRKVNQLTCCTERAATLCEIVLLELSLRTNISNQCWSEVQALVKEIASKDKIWHECSTAVQVTGTFLELLLQRRSVEQAILSCVVPPVAGWSCLEAAQEMIACINSQQLSEAIQNIENGTSQLKSTIIQELLTIAKFVARVIASVRRREWTQDSLEYSTETQDENQCVTRQIESMRAALPSLRTIQSFVSDFVSDMMKRLNLESAIVELERKVQVCFQMSRFGGSTGELLTTVDAQYALYELCHLLDQGRHITNSCHSLKRAEQTAKILYAAHTALSNSDVTLLVQLTSLLSYTATRPSSDWRQVRTQYMTHRDCASTMLAADSQWAHTNEIFVESLCLPSTKWSTLLNHASPSPSDLGFDTNLLLSLIKIEVNDVTNPLLGLYRMRDEAVTDLFLLERHVVIDFFKKQFVGVVNNSREVSNVIQCLTEDENIVLHELKQDFSESNDKFSISTMQKSHDKDVKSMDDGVYAAVLSIYLMLVGPYAHNKSVLNGIIEAAKDSKVLEKSYNELVNERLRAQARRSERASWIVTEAAQAEQYKEHLDKVLRPAEGSPSRHHLQIFSSPSRVPHGAGVQSPSDAHNTSDVAAKLALFKEFLQDDSKQPMETYKRHRRPPAPPPPSLSVPSLQPHAVVKSPPQPSLVLNSMSSLQLPENRTITVRSVLSSHDHKAIPGQPPQVGDVLQLSPEVGPPLSPSELWSPQQHIESPVVIKSAPLHSTVSPVRGCDQPDQLRTTNRSGEDSPSHWDLLHSLTANNRQVRSQIALEEGMRCQTLARGQLQPVYHDAFPQLLRNDSRAKYARTAPPDQIHQLSPVALNQSTQGRRATPAMPVKMRFESATQPIHTWNATKATMTAAHSHNLGAAVYGMKAQDYAKIAKKDGTLKKPAFR